jgi:hypothetical protein
MEVNDAYRDSVAEDVIEKLAPHSETFAQWRLGPDQLRILVRLAVKMYLMNRKALDASIERTQKDPERYKINCLVRDAIEEVLAED